MWIKTKRWPKRWGVLAKRGGGPGQGATMIWCESEGELLLFSTHAEALKIADVFNSRASADLSYLAAAFD